ncbi:anaphase-promoting complex subunit Cut9 [Sporothrix eucalyptigena]|uniref:Anaphase-promoting complex subunit Cut9 n=1 Tax=Sporothrix eucalyptigena TaxID=1812306 RepID=A0ABP0BTF6_9PEZI
MEPFLRDWRQDALNKAQYDSAIFIGDKLLALTGADEDAFWLAQVHFAMGNYTRAQALLSKSDLIARNASCRYLAAHCLIKQSRFDDALAVLGERNPTHLIPTSANKRKAPSGAGPAAAAGGNEKTGQSSSGNGGSSNQASHAPPPAQHHGGKKSTTFGAGSKSSTAGGKGHASSRSIGGAADKGAGPSDRRRDREASIEAEAAAVAAAAAAAASAAAAAAVAAAEASNRRYEAGMCYLRGICYAKQNVFDRAKECYKDAVRIDVQCFEAFQQLTKNQLMAPDEEWEFLESLNFESITVNPGPDGSSPNEDVVQEAADFTRMLYSTRLSKYRNPDAFAAAAESLATHYRLGNNADLLLARADLAYTQCRYEDALALTSSVLEEDRYNFGAYPLHLACLFELRMKNVLFLVAHDLADQHPEEPCTWLAVGVYYFATDRIAEARRYFSKASMMDAHYGPAWIGFAHTFAAEGEHDQAISAYSTAARLFTGTHLPQVFLGMQHHAMNNMTVAEEFLKTAYGLCREDPLLLNEMGVVCYHQDRPKDAATLFRKALEVADDMDCDPQAWLSARINLGHAYRRMRLFREALAQFDEVLRLGGKNAAVFSAKGLILLERNRPDEAAVVLHEALAIKPQDPIATELLSKALAEMAASNNVLQLGVGNADMGRSGGGGIVAGMDDQENLMGDDVLIDAVRGTSLEAADDDLDANTVANFEHDLFQKRLAAKQQLAEALTGGETALARATRQRKAARKGKGKVKSQGGGVDDWNVEMEGAGDTAGGGDGAEDGPPAENNGVSRSRLQRTNRNSYMAAAQRQMHLAAAEARRAVNAAGAVIAAGDGRAAGGVRPPEEQDE